MKSVSRGFVPAASAQSGSMTPKRQILCSRSRCVGLDCRAYLDCLPHGSDLSTLHGQPVSCLDARSRLLSFMGEHGRGDEGGYDGL